MRSILITLVMLAVASPALALDGDTVRACEKQWRDQQAAARKAAPEGYRPIVARGARQEALAACLGSVASK